MSNYRVPHLPELRQRIQSMPDNLKKAAMVLKIGGIIVKINKRRWVLVHRQGNMFAMIVMDPNENTILGGGKYIHTYEHSKMLLEKIIREEGCGKCQVIKND